MILLLLHAGRPVMDQHPIRGGGGYTIQYNTIRLNTTLFFWRASQEEFGVPSVPNKISLVFSCSLKVFFRL